MSKNLQAICLEPPNTYNSMVLQTSIQLHCYLTIELISARQCRPLEVLRVLPVEALCTVKYYAYLVVAVGAWSRVSSAWRGGWLRVYLCVLCLYFQGKHHETWARGTELKGFFCVSVPRGPLSHNLPLVQGMMWWQFYGHGLAEDLY